MYEKFFKRVIDVALSLLALAVLFPVLVILTVVGAIAMKGNPFFTQLRPGRIDRKTGKEKIFRLIKFRTMSNAKDKDGKLLPDKQRLNKYGWFLRSSSLDELPELLNILKGDMSIIGPRPQLVRDMVFMTAEQRKRHSVRPGLSGLAQVNGRNFISGEKKFEYDLKYIEHITFLTDVKIILKTFATLFKKGENANEGRSGNMDFGDWLVLNGSVDEETYEKKQQEAKELMNV